jgi:hypothetical protein
MMKKKKKTKMIVTSRTRIEKFLLDHLGACHDIVR